MCHPVNDWLVAKAKKFGTDKIDPYNFKCPKQYKNAPFVPIPVPGVHEQQADGLFKTKKTIGVIKMVHGVMPTFVEPC